MPRKSGSLLANALVLIISLGVAGGVGGILVRLYLIHHTVYDVEMSRYAALIKISSPDPRIGHVHIPNASATLMNVSVRTNSDGLRDVEHTITHGDRYRIVFLGDSITFGWGVDERQTF